VLPLILFADGEARCSAVGMILPIILDVEQVELLLRRNAGGSRFEQKWIRGRSKSLPETESTRARVAARSATDESSAGLRYF